MRKLLSYLKSKSSFVLYQTFVPLAPGVEQSSKLSGLYSSGDLVTFINRLFVFSLTVGAIIAVVRIMIAGYLYMGHGDMWSSLNRAKEILTDVVFGLLLLLAIYLILFQINPNLLNLDVLKSFKSNSSAQSGALQTGVAGAPY